MAVMMMMTGMVVVTGRGGGGGGWFAQSDVDVLVFAFPASTRRQRVA
jgi:hypothetical protein